LSPCHAGCKAEEIDAPTGTPRRGSKALGIVEHDRAKWADAFEGECCQFPPQVSVDHDDVELLDRMARDEIFDRLDGPCCEVYRDVMQRYIRAELRPDPRKPVPYHAELPTRFVCGLFSAGYQAATFFFIPSGFVLTCAYTGFGERDYLYTDARTC